ncbi:MAG: hypothetical protein K6B40_05660 [Firmicutes bacterium]|nr:hypothetical protein [Bacillota bacterium]
MSNPLTGKSGELQELFPRLTANLAQEKTYSVSDTQDLLALHQFGYPSADGLDMTTAAIDFTISCMWPFVGDFFTSDIFSNRFSAAVQILQAAPFAAEEAPQVQDLAGKLAQLLLKWEESSMDNDYLLADKAAEEPCR